MSAPGPLQDPERVHAVIFASRNMLERLQTATEVHVDGTFKVKMYSNNIIAELKLNFVFIIYNFFTF